MPHYSFLPTSLPHPVFLPFGGEMQKAAANICLKIVAESKVELLTLIFHSLWSYLMLEGDYC